MFVVITAAEGQPICRRSFRLATNQTEVKLKSKPFREHCLFADHSEVATHIEIERERDVHCKRASELF